MLILKETSINKILNCTKLLKSLINTNKSQAQFLSSTCINKNVDNETEKDTMVSVSEETDAYNAIKQKYNDKLMTIPRHANTQITTSDSFYQVPQFHGSKRHETVVLFSADAYLGMGKDAMHIPRVREMYEYASEYLQYDLIKVSTKGPLRDLGFQTFQQPAVFVAGLAASERLREVYPDAIENCVATSGFSIGEIIAQVFCGALKFEDGLRLAMVRGEAMHVAQDMTLSALMTIQHDDNAQIEVACKQAILNSKGFLKVDHFGCEVAYDLYPNCKILGGDVPALKYISFNKELYGITKCKRVMIMGAFHTNLMRIAAEPLHQYTFQINYEDPLIPLYSNLTGEQYADAEEIKYSCVAHIHNPVQWQKIMYNIYRNNPEHAKRETFICGPGRTLKTILKYNKANAADKCYEIKV